MTAPLHFSHAATAIFIAIMGTVLACQEKLPERPPSMSPDYRSTQEENTPHKENSQQDAVPKDLRNKTQEEAPSQNTNKTLEQEKNTQNHTKQEKTAKTETPNDTTNPATNQDKQPHTTTSEDANSNNDKTQQNQEPREKNEASQPPEQSRSSSSSSSSQSSTQSLPSNIPASAKDCVQSTNPCFMMLEPKNIKKGEAYTFQGYASVHVKKIKITVDSYPLCAPEVKDYSFSCTYTFTHAGQSRTLKYEAFKDNNNSLGSKELKINVSE